MSHEYESMRRVSYGDGNDEFGRAVFVPVCPNCSRFVRAHETFKHDGHGQPTAPNATCKQCGEVEMPFEGWF